jgi:SSS family solute:Na+ symporter
MTWIDWIILAAYAAGTIWMGWWVGRRQKNSSEYFTGSGRMNPLLVGVSLFATLLSTITYLAIPGEVLGKGPVYLVNYLCYPLVFLVVTRVLLPVYMRQRVTSAYELLEARLGLSVRLLGTAMFLMMRLVWMALLIFLTSRALVTVMEVDPKWTPLVVAVTGLVSITYASVGGLRAVVVTDLMQTLLLYGGAVLVIATVTIKMGGFSWWPSEWRADVWDHQPVFSLDPSVRVTMAGTLVSVFLWMVATSAGDQVSIQRFMSTKDLPAARRAVAMQLSIGMVVGITLGVVGVALLGFYAAHPEMIPEGKTLAAAADSVFPDFIANHLPPVVTGLVVAGLFAAAMSSIDSGVNSITAVVTSDLLLRLGWHPSSAASQVRVTRWLAFGIGFTVVALSSELHRIDGNFMAVTNKTVNLLTVPIATLFVLALYVPRAGAATAWMATVAGVVCAAMVAFSGEIFGKDPVTGRDPVSFQWTTLAALTGGWLTAAIGCLLFPRRRD